MLYILWAILILAGLGLIFGIILGVCAKVFEVKEDPRIAEVEKMLPNANCGSCGYAGCHDMACHLISGEAKTISKCRPCKPEAKQAIYDYIKSHPNEDGSEVNVTL